MKKMKKLIALVIACAMVLGMSMTTMAANEDGIIGTPDDTGTITVSGIDAEDGIAVTAYQIVKVTYDNNNNFSGYALVYPDVDPAISLVPDDNGDITITQANLNAIIAEEKADGTTYTMTKAEGSEDYTAEVPVGSYLVVVSGADAKVYSPMVVSVNYINDAGVNAIAGGTVTTIADGNAWVKESDVPGFTKIEEDALGNSNGDFILGNSVDAGKDVIYTLKISSVPYYGGDHPVFNVVDKIQDGLTYGDKFAVYLDADKDGEIKITENSRDLLLTENTHYTLVKEDQTFTIDFVVNDEYTLNDYQGANIFIKYHATLETADNNFNECGYRNDAELTFTYDSKIDSENVKDTIREETYTYTFNLTEKLLKIGEGEDAEALAGATFELFEDEACTIPYVNSFDADGVYVTNAEGKLEIKGIEAGTYWLKETKAPTGYSVNTHVYKIEVKAAYGEDGQLTSWNIAVDGEDTNSLTIPNTKLVNLPSTGGIGTTIFTIGGAAIIIAAASLLFARRRIAK